MLYDSFIYFYFHAIFLHIFWWVNVTVPVNKTIGSFLMANFSFKFGSGKDTTSKRATVGLEKLQLLKARVETCSAGLDAGGGRYEGTGPGRRLLFSLCIN